MASIPGYPLQWPDHIERSKTRESGRFRTSLNGALKNVREELHRFGRDSGKPIKDADISITSNATLGDSKPSDPGVAIWFTWDGMPICIPVDRYTTVESNLQAIYHVIEARRTELRHGTLALIRASMKGFLALPAPRRKQWWETLEIDKDTDFGAVRAAFNRLAKIHHPDRGGEIEAWNEILRARDLAAVHFGVK